MKTEQLLPWAIPLESAWNVRTLGGYPTVYGDVTGHTFLRGDCLCTMAPSDVNTLLNFGVRAVIDLRGEEEQKQIPDAFAMADGVRYLPIPLLEEAGGQALPFDMSAFSMDMVYIDILENARDRLSQVFRSLLENGREGKVLFHCTAGKDRTGVVAALLLGLAGVDSDWIVYDYTLTGQRLAPVEGLLAKASGAQAWPPALSGVLLGCDAASMEKTLAHLNARYTGAREYLFGLGFCDKECDELAAMMRKGFTHI